MKELTSKQELILEKNLVWIFGNDYYGNNWLKRLLSINTRPFLEPRITEHLAVLVGSALPNLVRRVDDYKKYQSYFFSEKYRDTWNYYLRKLILNRIDVQINDLSKKIVIQETQGVGACDIISECIPNCKIVILLRKPIDGIQDIINNVRKEVVQSEADRKLFIKIQIEWWNKLAQNFITVAQKHNQEKIIIINSDELRNNTLEHLKRIYQYLEIEVEPEQLKKTIEETPLMVYDIDVSINQVNSNWNYENQVHLRIKLKKTPMFNPSFNDEPLTVTVKTRNPDTQSLLSTRTGTVKFGSLVNQGITIFNNWHGGIEFVQFDILITDSQKRVFCSLFFQTLSNPNFDDKTPPISEPNAILVEDKKKFDEVIKKKIQNNLNQDEKNGINKETKTLFTKLRNIKSEFN